MTSSLSDLQQQLHDFQSYSDTWTKMAASRGGLLFVTCSISHSNDLVFSIHDLLSNNQSEKKTSLLFIKSLTLDNFVNLLHQVSDELSC